MLVMTASLKVLPSVRSASTESGNGLQLPIESARRSISEGEGENPSRSPSPRITFLRTSRYVTNGPACAFGSISAYSSRTPASLRWTS